MEINQRLSRVMPEAWKGPVVLLDDDAMAGPLVVDCEDPDSIAAADGAGASEPANLMPPYSDIALCREKIKSVAMQTCKQSQDPTHFNLHFVKPP